MFETGAYGHLSDYLWWYVVVASLLVHTWCFFKLCRPDRHPRLRLIGGNALITLCMLSVVALGAETYLRFVSVTTDGYGASLTSKRWHKAYASLNSMFCRDKEWTEEKPVGTRRIAFVGDSFTYGWGINNPDDLFTSILQRRFDNGPTGSVEVMNVAWPNWDTDRHIESIRTITSVYDVDEVILCYLPNDIITVLPVMDQVDPRALPEQYTLNTQTSFLMDYLYLRLVPQTYSSVRNYCDWIWDGYRDPDVWAKQTAQLDAIVETCADRDVTLRVALFPFLRVWGERYDGPALHKQLADFFRYRNVDVVDLLPTTAGFASSELTVNAVDAHPNEMAHQRFADEIWKAFFEKN